VSGLPAAGKTTIASRLAQQLRAAHVRIDTASADIDACITRLRQRADL
jgi:predicted kinase